MTELRIIAFPGAPNLPLFAALEHGTFRDAGLAVTVTTTPSSVFQFEQFSAGAFDIAFTAFDNVVAYSEGQGAARLAAPPDFKVILGATQIELGIVAAPDVEKAADLKGRTVALDAVSTGFAFVLYDMLERLGLPRSDYEQVAVGSTPDRWASVKAGTHSATMTIEPFTSIARAAGFRLLAKSTDMFAAYQGGIIAAREGWAKANASTVRAFIAAYLKGLAWTLDAANREAAAALLLARMPDIKPGVVGAVLDSVLSPRSGLTPGGQILPEGIKAVLDLRSKYGRPQAVLTDIDKYLALSFADDARAGL